MPGRDEACIRFLQWCLPELGLRWKGYRKVRRTVCKRITRRLRELGLADLEAYRRYLAAHPEEWRRLDGFCRIPISRFYRDRRVFETIGKQLLPELARRARDRGAGMVRCWSAGCASGEEAYSLRIAWQRQASVEVPGMGIAVLGTDAEPQMLQRARAAVYAAGSLKDMPAGCTETAFTQADGLYRLRDEFRERTEFRLQDIREEMPDGPFDLICCRNLSFTYFDEPRQRSVLAELSRRLRDHAYLVIGAHERLPGESPSLQQLDDLLPIYRKLPAEPVRNNGR